MAGMSQKVFCDSDALFTRNGIAPVRDDRGDRELILMYPLPDSAQRIASLCSEVLASGYGVADDEPLLFTLIQYPSTSGRFTAAAPREVRQR
jgi:hypothetical protein